MNRKKEGETRTRKKIHKTNRKKVKENEKENPVSYAFGAPVCQTYMMKMTAGL